MLLIRIVAYTISLLRSSGLWVTFRGYKHFAPPELSVWLRLEGPIMMFTDYAIRCDNLVAQLHANRT